LIIQKICLLLQTISYKNKILRKQNMYLTLEKKKEFFKTYGKSEKNTGSTEGQIALFSHRISHLTGHLKSNKKDFGTQRALLVKEEDFLII